MTEPHRSRRFTMPKQDFEALCIYQSGKRTFISWTLPLQQVTGHWYARLKAGIPRHPVNSAGAILGWLRVQYFG
jgi:hypothetical protein